MLHPNKPGKIRVAFDAGAKKDGISLNSRLITDPDLLNSLPGILIRFRNYPIVIMADVEAMFHQVRVTKTDQLALRFLWKDKGLESSKVETFCMTVHIMGATNSSCAASYALRKSAEDNSQDCNPETVKTIERDFYMDDLIKSCPNTEMATIIAVEVRKILKRGGFPLKKFLSNEPSVLTSLPPEDLAQPLSDLTFDESLTPRALGIRWNVKSDTLLFLSLIHI